MHVFRSMIIDAPIERVWSAVRAFDGVAAWNPGVASARLETGRSTEVGALRRLDAQDGSIFRETLVGHSDLEHAYTYDIVEGPLPVSGYISTHRFLPITATDQTLGIWESTFDCAETDRAEMDKVVGDEIYIGGMSGLAAWLKETADG
ncbi:MAG: SRPBCC family protein [Pseudomonadota bacterium]